MATIENRAIEYARFHNRCDRCKKDDTCPCSLYCSDKLTYIQIATSEARIARQERERCIKAALQTTCECCMSHHVGCDEQESCEKLCKIRKAMEGGYNGNN